MKQVPRKDLPQVSGGLDEPTLTSELPIAPVPLDYPNNPFGPVLDAPVCDPTDA